MNAYTRRLVRGTTAVPLFFAMWTAEALAQDAQFSACYVREVGALYLIRLPGLPEACLSSSHEEVGWTEGANGELADGSVGTSALANDAVTREKLGRQSVDQTSIVPSSIRSAHIGPGQVRGEHLQVRYQKVRRRFFVGATVADLDLTCPDNLEVLVGGVESILLATVDLSYPLDEHTWRIRGQGNPLRTGSLTVFVLCADLT